MTSWLAVLGVIAMTTAAQAQSTPAAPAQSVPAALVEDVTGTAAGVEFMDYVPAGKVLRLNLTDSIVLSYLKSCVRESITGATIKVGTERSDVVGGTVKRETVKCDKGNLNLTANQGAKSGVMVMRSGRTPAPAPAADPNKPELTLYGLSPIIDLKGGGMLVIERMDQPGDKHEMQIPAVQALRGTYVDFAKTGKALVAGGLYKASAAGQTIVFKVDPFAQPGQAPIVGRLLRFQRPS